MAGLSFYFYDLETSGISPRWDRIMQFGGQRTDLSLKPICKPYKFIIKLDDDVLPQPDAILTHSITPQKTRADGISERQFLHFFIDKIVAKETIFVGYNNIRFDDEFIRFALWRNFFDAYEWQWQEGCSRFDLLDVARMTRALRPDGINWPFAPDGKPTVRLELMAAINKLGHPSVHDALSDVKAEMALSRLLRLKQPKLFDYLLNLRKKTKVEVLVNARAPVVYSSGHYPSEYEKTTVAVMVGPRADQPGALMYDLRIDPKPFLDMEPPQLAKLWSDRSREAEYFPVKILAYNRCPAVAPIKVLDKKSLKRLELDLKKIDKHLVKLKAADDFTDRLNKAWAMIHPPRQSKLVVSEDEVDGLLYDSFVSKPDKTRMSVVRAADSSEITKLTVDFDDERLKVLLPLYKARNFPQSLTRQEQLNWEKFKARKLLGGGDDSMAAKHFKRIEELAQKPQTTRQQQHLLKELKIYGESILPQPA